MKIFNKSVGLILLLSLSVFFCPVLVRSDDGDDETDQDAIINEEAPANANDDVQTAAETEADEEGSDQSTSSPFVKTSVLFIQPESTDLPAGRLARLLVSFQNNGSSSFLVESVEGSFRYPQDFSYYIQNFTSFDFNKVVESEKEATFEYLLTPSETFSSRQFGLTINLRYRDIEGKSFVNAVFNETINVVEPEEGLDGETFFVYIFLSAIVVLLLVAAQQFFSVFKKKGSRSKPTYNTSAKQNGVSTSEDVDLAWIPKTHLQPNVSPKVSPRQRKTQKTSSASGNSSNDEQ